MIKKIYTDIHRFSAKPVPTVLTYDKNSVFLGDLDDVHCRYKDVKAMISSSAKHRWLCDTSMRVIQVRSNHGGEYENGLPEYVIENGVLYCHGHTAFYSEKDKLKWYTKEAGIPWWKFYGIKVTNIFRNLKGNKVSNKKLITLAEYAIDISEITGEVIHTIIVGHLHRSHDGTINGIRVVVCNCGVTEVEV